MARLSSRTRSSYAGRWFVQAPDITALRTDPRYHTLSPATRAKYEYIWQTQHPTGVPPLPPPPRRGRRGAPAAKKAAAAKKRAPAPPPRPPLRGLPYYQFCVAKYPHSALRRRRQPKSWYKTIYTFSAAPSSWHYGSIVQMCDETVYILCLKRTGTLDFYNPRIIDTCDDDFVSCSSDCIERVKYPKHTKQWRARTRRRRQR